MKEVLHVGCGKATIRDMTAGFQEGWQEIRFDIEPAVKPDIVGTTADMVAVEDESVDAVYSSHNIEHVYAFQVDTVLREFLRVLRPGGFLVVTCPDIQKVAEYVARGQLTEPLYMSPSGPISAMDIIYGHDGSIRKGADYMAHRTAFTSRTLHDALRGAGFATIGVSRRKFDLWALATKVAISETDARALMKQYLHHAR